MKKKIYLLSVFLILFSPLKGYSFLEETKTHFKQILCHGKNELYIPVNTWHNRLTYEHDKIREYNERPWGVGFGKVLMKDSHRYSLGVMEFQDYHNDIEPILAYKWQKV